MWMSRPRLFGQPFMGSSNSNVQAESGPARALNVSCLLFGHSSFPETALSTPAHKPRPAARGGGPALLVIARQADECAMRGPYRVTSVARMSADPCKSDTIRV